jgi:excisionase family DNA binding protein
MASRVIARRSDPRDGKVHVYTLYRVGDAAHLLGISRWTLSRLIDSGHIRPAENTGLKTVRVTGKELQRYLDSLNPEPEPEGGTPDA